MMSNTDLKGKLETYYGDGFGKKFATAKKTHKTPRAALNSIEIVEKNSQSLTGLLAATGTRLSRDRTTITGLTFSLITEDGDSRAVRTPGKKYGGQEVIAMVQKDWPDVPRLGAVTISNLRSRYSIVTDFTSYYLTEQSAINVLDDLDVNLPVTFSFEEAVALTSEQMESGASTFETSPHLVFAEITSVRAYEDEDGDIANITATLRDLNGETINTKIEANLEDFFDEETAEDMGSDPEELNLALRRMPVLARGRVFIGREGQVIPGSNDVFERDVVSFIVKGSGWIMNAEELPESVGKRLQEQISSA